MPHATFRQSRASRSKSVRRRDATPQRRLAQRVSDLALADAVAHAVQVVPGVAELSPGLVTPVATYGPGRSVAGVVIRHPTLETLAIEVHVDLSEAHCMWAVTAADDRGARDSEGCAPITEVAHLVRGEVRRSTQDMTSSALVRVDVFIDDLR
jgi:uncharacterized alkaline shock family protein YloU